MVVLAPGNPATQEQVRAALGAKLTKIELPEQMQLVDSLPLTSSGKPDKQRIKILFKEQ